MKFRKKPVVIEAFKWTGGKDQQEDPSWIVEAIKRKDVEIEYPLLKIATLEGVMVAKVGDWIIKGVQGELYPCKPDIFEATYEFIYTIEDALEELKTAQYIGEDGDMVVNCETKEEALKKFKQLTLETAGEVEAGGITDENIGTGWVHLTNDDQKKRMENSEWFISYREPNEHSVWVHSY